MTTIAYLRCSTEEQADSGAGIAAQRQTINAYFARQSIPEPYMDGDGTLWAPTPDWRWITDLGVSGGLPWHQRPQLRAAIDDLNHGLASTLVVAKLDRLTRSLLDFATIMELSKKKGWALVALDLGVDTATPSGRMLAGILAVFAEFERGLISQRTKDALAAKRAQGVHTGRRSTLDPYTRSLIVAWARAEMTPTEIAASLNGKGCPTGQNGTKWRASSVAAVLKASTP